MRRRAQTKREILPDPKYDNLVVAKLINYIMWDGEKDTARRVVYDAFDIIAKKTKKDPLSLLFHPVHYCLALVNLSYSV